MVNYYLAYHAVDIYGSEGISIVDLALEKGVNLDAQCSINGLTEYNFFETGEWVIIPATPREY